MCTDKVLRYSGVDNLEVMMEATNYNAHLIDIVTSYAKSTKVARGFRSWHRNVRETDI